MADEAEPQKVRPISALSDLVPKAWVDPTKYAAIMMEFYTSGLARDSIGRLLAEGVRGVVDAISPHPVTWTYVKFGQEIPISALRVYSVYADGERDLAIRYDQDVIPAGDCVVFVSPVPGKENGGTVEGDPAHAIGIARGALMALAGHTAAEQLIVRTTPTIDKLDFMTRSGGVMENFEPADSFVFCDPASVARLASCLATHLPPERRLRSASALTFIGRAAAEMDATVRFSHLWIALEVVAGGFGQIDRMVGKLAKAEGARTKLAEIKEARRQLFHEGRRYSLSQDQERLMCAVVMAQLLSWYGIVDVRLNATIEELGHAGTGGMSLER